MNDEEAKVAELWARVAELDRKAQLCLEDWNGEDWLDFARAATEISDKLAIPLGPAEAQLRELCGSGKIRAITLPLDVNEAPQFIPPSRWWREDVDFKTVLAVSYSDLLYWLDQQKPEEVQDDPKPRTSYRRNLVEHAIAELQLPANLPNQDIVDRVGKWLQSQGQPVPSRTTILRAAGRRSD